MIGGLLSGLEEIVVKALNALILALGTVLQAAFSALPDLPALPGLPDAFVTAEGWVAWFFPVGTVIDALAFVLSMYLLWQAVAIALRWAKALGDS